MSDLEDLWDDLPVGPAPTGAILRQARAQSPRRSRRRMLRPMSSIAALAALGTAFVIGTYVAQPLRTGPARAPPARPATRRLSRPPSTAS